MKQQNFVLINPKTGQHHQIKGISPVGSPVALLQKPSGMGLYHNQLSEALAFAEAGDTVLLLRDCREYVTLRDKVNINANGFSLISDADAPLLTDGGKTVQCEVTNFERLESTFAGGVSEWNALLMVTGAGSNVTIQGKQLITPAAGLNWNGKCVINQGVGATITLRMKLIKANGVEVAADKARIIVEDGRFDSPMASSYTYRLPAGSRGAFQFNNMDIHVGNLLTFDQGVTGIYNRCRIVSERLGILDQGLSNYTFIDCQVATQNALTARVETSAIHNLSDNGSLDLVGVNTFVARGNAASWLFNGATGTPPVRIMGKLISNKPSPAANFNPLVGTAANGSILIDAAAALSFLQ